MIKLGTIEFDECLLDAIREEKLVIFAGAGVSKGSPSNLDDFVTLANKIAEGKGLTASVPLDRFLGELHHQGVSVHQRAVPLLTPPNSRPTSLHKDLIRLFKTGKNVRVVTTNFDLHFENAFESIFTDTSLRSHVYHAPALPRGQRFHGIVHVHGSIEFPEDMVLTDADFGRAYLTEGWARQFLVEVFRSYTVLFVGYSHDDIVMNYLARALPSDNVAGRFALTDKKENWRLLGITPLLFTKDTFSELNDSVKALADWTNRGALAWQTRIADIARETPPTDIENGIIGEIRLILSDPSKTRCFTAHAYHNEWVYWLEQYGYLKPLFEQSKIDECHILLMNWLIKNFVIDHPNVIYRLIAAQGVRLNPLFWSNLIRNISLTEDKIPEPSALKRWVTILLSCIPANGDETYIPLIWLAEQCSRQNQLPSVVRIFQVLIKHNIVLRSESFDPEHENIYIDYRLSAPHYHLNEIWEKCLEPHVQLIHASLLTSLVCCFEDIHQDLCSWDRVSTDWDPISDGRAAIEPHEQDRHPEDIDSLIDITRDILHWLIVNNPTEGELWVAKLSLSEVAVLRRIAIHTISEHQDLTAEKRLEWLLDHFDLYSLAEKHEIYHLAFKNYPLVNSDTRQRIIDKILTHQSSARSNWTEEQSTNRDHFDWLAWLEKCKPDCSYIQSKISPIKTQYPEWQLDKYPDLNSWSETWAGSKSPCSVDDLLTWNPQEKLEYLLTFKGTSFRGPEREGLIGTVRAACQKNISWSFNLTDILIEKSEYSTDLWPAIINGWAKANLNRDDWHNILLKLEHSQLHSPHAYPISNLFLSIFEDQVKPYALEILEQVNTLSHSVWEAIEGNEDEPDNWLNVALNAPEGKIVQFWLHGLSQSQKPIPATGRTLIEPYIGWLTEVVQSPGRKGATGRSLLTSQLSWLSQLNKQWVLQHLIPLFNDDNDLNFTPAWDGFLSRGCSIPELQERLIPAYLPAIHRFAAGSSRREKFVNRFTELVLFYVDNPTSTLFPQFFQNITADDRIEFARCIKRFLSTMQSETVAQLCNRWLTHYWELRQQGIPTTLNDSEFKIMLEWLPALGDAFPDIVSIVISARPITLENNVVPYLLRESDLVTKFPDATARLLIYLSQSISTMHNAQYMVEISHRLTTLSSELRSQLDEEYARKGFTV